MKKIMVKVVGLLFVIAVAVAAVSLGCPEVMAKGAGMLFAALAVIAE